MHKATAKKASKSHVSATSKSHKAIKKTIKKSDLENFSKAGTDRAIVSNTMQLDYGSKFVNNLMQVKKDSKAELMAALPKVKMEGRCAMILIFATDLNGDKELFPREQLFKLLDGLRVLNIKAVVIDTQQPSDLNNLGELQDHSHGQIIWYNPRQDNSGHGREEKEVDRLLLAADMAVIFNEHMDLINLLMNYGIVPIAEDKSPLLENYKPNEETGNSFLFNKKDLWSVFAAVVRALETYKFPYDWSHIVREIEKD